MQITFTPTLSEHFRATGELRRVARVYDATAALPYFLVCLVISSVVTQDRMRTGPLTLDELIFLVIPLMFFAGAGIRVRQGLGRGVSYEFGTAGIEVRQPRHH